jgi:ABC-type lipoprotein export system ATPase subunit
VKIRLSNVIVKVPKTGRRLFSVREMEVPQGSKILIQGASGLGKTTFLHLIAGLFLPDEGSVYLDDKSLNRLSEDERASLRYEALGLVFQKLNLLQHLTVEENIFLGLSEALSSKQKIREILKRVMLEDRSNQISSTLSLGEQQRVAVARVLARRPQLILADEPTSSLDNENTTRVMKSLFEAAQGRTLLVVSHDDRIKKEFDRCYSFEEWVNVK